MVTHAYFPSTSPNSIFRYLRLAQKTRWCLCGVLGVADRVLTQGVYSGDDMCVSWGGVEGQGIRGYYRKERFLDPILLYACRRKKYMLTMFLQLTKRSEFHLHLPLLTVAPGGSDNDLLPAVPHFRCPS